MNKKRRYGRWRGNPNGIPEDDERCVFEVYPTGRSIIPFQCLRKRGYGRGGMYCKQHAKITDKVESITKRIS